jgi:hypothetical protein
MNANSMTVPLEGTQTPIGKARVPAAIQWLYTAFMAVLVPVYWMQYGPTNFLYFCDVALFLTLVGVWTGNRLLISMPAVGILLPQVLWCADFLATCLGGRITGMTAYMFDGNRPIFLRGLSMFHGWLPFLLLFLVRRVGYDRRAFGAWTLSAWVLCIVCFTTMPPAGPEGASKLVPNNINYVWGFDDAQPQSWLPAKWYLVGWMSALAVLIYWPTHCLLIRWVPDIPDASRNPVSPRVPGMR